MKERIITISESVRNWKEHQPRELLLNFFKLYPVIKREQLIRYESKQVLGACVSNRSTNFTVQIIVFVH